VDRDCNQGHCVPPVWQNNKRWRGRVALQTTALLILFSPGGCSVGRARCDLLSHPVGGFVLVARCTDVYLGKICPSTIIIMAHSCLGFGPGPVSTTTKQGAIQGSYDRHAQVFLFRGIPYAAPPVGELRFKRPVPHPRWGGVRRCTSFGPMPPQTMLPCLAPAFVPPLLGMSHHHHWHRHHPDTIDFMQHPSHHHPSLFSIHFLPKRRQSACKDRSH